MIQLLFFIGIIAFAVLLYFNNRVKNRRIDRINRLAEKQDALIQMLNDKNNHEDNVEKSSIKP